jgi:hypothetical protein
MDEIVIDEHTNGNTKAYFKGWVWEREFLDGEEGRFAFWRCHSSNEDFSSQKFHDLLEKLYESGNFNRVKKRFPRLDITKDDASFYAIPTISEIPKSTSRWLIKYMIQEGTINLLTAPPGGFKTWLSMWMGGCVSTGADCLGHETVSTKVLYLDRENPPSVIRKRRKLLNLSSERFRVWGHWWKHNPPDIDDPRLMQLARRHRLFIIIDSFVRFHSADENSAKQMAQVLRRLRALADAGATILLLHHQAKTKGSQYRGSTDILAGVDAAFELFKEKSKDEPTFTLRCFKHRVIEETTTKIRLNLQKGRFEVVDDSSVAISSTVIAKIKEVIATHRRITQQDLLQKAELPETKGRKILQNGDGVHWRSKRGKGNTLHYWLKD